MLALPLVLICAAQMYEWTDSSGVQHFSDQPPPAGVKAKITEGVELTEMGAPAPTPAPQQPEIEQPAENARRHPPPARGEPAVERDEKTRWHERFASAYERIDKAKRL